MPIPSVLHRVKVKRKISLSDVGAIITSSKNPKEIVLHIPSEYDYRYLMNRRDDFIEIFKLRFVTSAPEKLLKFFEVVCLCEEKITSQPGDTLKDFTTTEQDMKYAISRCPDDTMRRKDIEVKGAAYIEKKQISLHGGDRESFAEFEVDEEGIQNSRASFQGPPEMEGEETAASSFGEVIGK